MYVLILTCWILNLLKNGINWKRNAGKQIPKYAIYNGLNNALHFVLLIFAEVKNEDYLVLAFLYFYFMRGDFDIEVKFWFLDHGLFTAEMCMHQAPCLIGAILLYKQMQYIVVEVIVNAFTSDFFHAVAYLMSYK